MILGRLHVNEIDHDQATQIPQAQLAADLVGGLKIGAGGGFFDVATLGGFSGIDVDRDQGFGRLDDDRTATRQTHGAGKGRFDLAFYLIAGEERHAVFV